MMRALDLFCGGGGATRGLQLAGYHVTGVDLHPQPEYCGDAFTQADALSLPLEGYDLIWASPPCQRYTTLRGLGKSRANDVDLIDPIRDRLKGTSTPYIIENVVGAPLVNPVTLCGSMFGLESRRHRLFECSFPCAQPRPCACRGRRNIAVYGKRPGDRLPDGVQRAKNLAEGQRALGIDWLSWRPLTQAIPPAYAWYLASHATGVGRDADLECGADTTYGPNNTAHSDWCPKYVGER